MRWHRFKKNNSGDCGGGGNASREMADFWGMTRLSPDFFMKKFMLSLCSQVNRIARFAYQIYICTFMAVYKLNEKCRRGDNERIF